MCSWSLLGCILVVVLSALVGSVRSNDFSSFLSANASLAVVVDHEYMQQKGENILNNFQKILSDTIRENLKNGGINVRYFTWSAVRLKKDFLAAITVTDCKNTWKFYEASQITSILLIAITDADCPRLPKEKAMMIPIVESSEVFSQMILDTKVQKALNWKSATLLIDESMVTENPLLVESVMLENTKNHIAPVSMILYTLDDARLRGQKRRNRVRDILERFAQQRDEHHQFMVLTRFYEDVIEVAQSLRLFNIYNQWLFFVMEESPRQFDAMTVTQNLAEGANVAFVLNETQPDCQFSMNCTIAEVSLAFVTAISRMIAEEQSIYGEISDEEWESIRFTKQEKQVEILQYMREHLKDHSKCASCARWRLETAISWGKNKELRRYQINRITPGLPVDARNRNFEFLNVGYWSPLLGYVTDDSIFPHIQHYFRNISMAVLTMHNPPWQILKLNEHGEVVEHRGIVMELLKELSRTLNFTYELYAVQSHASYDLRELNETNDLIGSLTYILPREVYAMMQQEKFLLGALAVSVDDPDKKPFNYTDPISVQRYAFISRRPDEVSRIYLFTAPFTLETWGSLMGVLILTAPVLYVINRLVPMQNLRIDGLCTMKNCFWYIYGALLQQGGMYLPKADSGRLIVGFWWLVVIVLVTTYCGNLVAFLTFPKFQPGLDYLFQLFKDSQVDQYGLRNGTLLEKYSGQTTRQDYRRYIENAIMYSNAQAENIDAVQVGSRVNIDWRINLQQLIQTHFERDKDCKFVLSKESFLDEQIALLVPTNSPYLSLINEKIKRLFQMGFIERWHQTNLPMADKCNSKSMFRQITNHKVNLEDMQGCFLVLLLGFLAALLILFAEYCYHRFYASSRPTHTREGFTS